MRPAGAVASGCFRSYRARSSSLRHCFPMGRNPTRCRNSCYASLLTLIRQYTRPAAVTAYRMVEQAGLPQTGFVHTRPPPGRPFLLVGFVIPANPLAPLPPAKARCARLSGLRQRASASTTAGVKAKFAVSNGFCGLAADAGGASATRGGRPRGQAAGPRPGARADGALPAR